MIKKGCPYSSRFSLVVIGTWFARFVRKWWTPVIRRCPHYLPAERAESKTAIRHQFGSWSRTISITRNVVMPWPLELLQLWETIQLAQTMLPFLRVVRYCKTKPKMCCCCRCRRCCPFHQIPRICCDLFDWARLSTIFQSWSVSSELMIASTTILTSISRWFGLCSVTRISSFTFARCLEFVVLPQWSSRNQKRS